MASRQERLLTGIALVAAAAWLAAWLAVLVATPVADRISWLPTPLAIGSIVTGVIGVGFVIAR